MQTYKLKKISQNHVRSYIGEIMDKKIKVAIYVRVSTLDQNPENQSIELLDYVKRFSDYELHKVYEDKVSGAKDSRPALDKLMQDSRKKLFDHVIFWKVDRLGRNAIHTQTVAEEWRKLGITFTITTLGIDTSTPAGKFIFGIFAQFAEMERALIIERTNLSLSRIRKEIEEKGYYINKDGEKRTTLGRPKGQKDKKVRTKSGYYQRWAKKK
jgi:DNA invertase Pin-like site-specific DNA recombinase